MEEVIARLYAVVLGKTGIGVEANFFSLGGHSLLAVRLAALLSEKLGRVVETAAVFHHPSVAALARHLEAVSPVDDDLSLMAGWLDSLD
jgi:acyl carrier protein